MAVCSPVAVLLLSISLFICSVMTSAPVTCPDVCPGTGASQYQCATSSVDFSLVGSPNWVWFSSVFSTGISGKGFSFTNQQITINGAVVANPPDAFVTVTGTTGATTGYSGGRWTTSVGSNCGNTFLSGIGFAPSSNLLTTGDWTWCGLFQSQDAVNVTWSFGASAFSTSLADMSTLNVKPSDNCPSSTDAAGTPVAVKGSIIGGGTVPTESSGDYVGVKNTPAQFQTCNCPVTAAPTAPTNAPTAPTNAPTAPTKAPTAPTNAPTAPTKAPTAPTNAPTPPTNAPTAPTKAPTAPTNAPTAPTNAPTNAPTPPTDAPTKQPTKAPTEAPTKAPTAPTNAPTPPTKAPTKAPTEAPTKQPTKAPTEAPTKAPTAPTNAPTAPTKAPTNAPTAPTEAPTKQPTKAPTEAPTKQPTPPTEAPTAPTKQPTKAPTEAPTKQPTEAPTEAPTKTPTPPTEAPTRQPTKAPTEAPTAPTNAPTRAPTEAPTRAPTPPTEAPTNAPTPPTVRPTRAPTAPTPVPLTRSPTTAAPTAPIDICTRVFTAHFTLTYDSMQYGYVGGLLVYDWTKNVLAFYYTNQQYQEIYQFNGQQGVGNTVGQNVIRISPNGTCAPCARYQNNWAFPVFWNVSGVANPYPTGVDSRGCTNYTVPASNNNWAQYYGLYPNGTLCFIGNQGRLFTIDSVEYCGKYSPNVTEAPFGCACNTPQDIVFALDRSTSILTSSTHIYREFISQFVNAYTFDPSSPTTSTQMGIVQYGNVLNPITTNFPIGNYGSIPFTMDGANIKNTVTQIGCVGNPCKFCNNNPNETNCVYPDVFRTCTSCGLYGAGQLFLDTGNFKKRQTSTKIIIVITDGNANVQNASNQPNGVPELCCGDGDPITQALVPGKDPNCDDGLWQDYFPYGCFYDITKTRQQVEALVSGVTIFAVGIGEKVNTETLKVIASNENAVFASPSWSEFLTSINSLLTITCVEPHPITSCGTGEAACGFCACGNTQLPDGIIPPNLCESVVIVPNGRCNEPVPTQLNCTTLPCKDTICVPSLNDGQGGCTYQDTVCNVVDECYEPKCIQGRCVPKAQCANSTNPACLIPCPPAPECPVDPKCANYTGGLGCGCNGTCNQLTGRCNCTGGYHGAFCQFPPGVPECTTTDECDDTSSCTTETCNNSTKECQYQDIVCDDGNACTLDFCNATGCQNVQNVVCNDNDGCTNDFCNATDAQCYYVDLLPECDYLEDICNIPYCDSTAPADDHCFQEPVVCPRDNNCTIALCVVNDTSGNNFTGCTNNTVDCVIVYIGIAAGIAAGVITAIVVAGVVLCFAVVSGSAYAVSQSNTLHTDQAVHANPLYRTGVKTGAGLVSK